MPLNRVAIFWVVLSAGADSDAVLAQNSPSTSSPSSTTQSGPGSDGTTIKQVTVTGRKSDLHRSPDKRSYDITHDLHASTGSIGDVLRNVPSVDVSPDGKVSLRGDPNVAIFVDGKPSSLFSGRQAAQAIQSLPADQYERVEVMTSPSAAYAPDGSAGIINLVTKKIAKVGDFGSIRLTGGVRGESIGVTANHKSDKLVVGFNGGLGRDWRRSSWGGQSQTLDAAGHPVSMLTMTNQGSQLSDWGYAGATIELNPDPKTQINGEVSATAAQVRSNMADQFGSEDQTLATNDVLDREDRSRFSNGNVHGGLTLRRNFGDGGHSLVLSATEDHGTNRNLEADTLASLEPAAALSYNNLVSSDTETHTDLKGDYTRPLPSKAVLETGFDIRFDAVDINRSGFLSAPAPVAPNDPGQTDRFQFNRRISAIYGTYDQPLGRLDVKLGLRWEATDIDLNDPTTNNASRQSDDRLYPTANLSWDLGHSQKLRASYGERVQRPEASQYDPFRLTLDPFYVSQGNPSLKLAQTQKFEFSYEYQHVGTYYEAAVYYQRDSHGFYYVPTSLGDNIVLITPENITRSSETGFELAANGRILKALRYNLSGNIVQNEIDAGLLSVGAPQAGWTAFGHASVDWAIDAKDLLQLQGNVSGKRLVAAGYYESRPQLNLGFRHEFSDRLALTLTINDLLGTSGSSSGTDSPMIRGTGWYKPHTKTAIINLTWSFGRGPKRGPEFDYGPETTPGSWTRQ
jgi:outer membrane receptor protein involved in Fe transport